MAVKIAFLGNLDNGKSTTIGRLLLDSGSLSKERVAELKRSSKALGKDVELAFLMDQFEEERRDSLTLDTAQAVLRTRSGERVLIDVPGHEELIRNMVSGAAQAQAAVLVLDVKEGLTDQAKRHLFLADFLGIDPIFVAVNKMDSAGYEASAFARVAELLLKFFKESGLKLSGVVPISAKEGENISGRSKHMGWHKGPALLALLEKVPEHHGRAKEYFQFPVQDVYPAGPGQLLVGRIDSGRVRKNQKVLVFPSGAEATVQEVKVFGKKTSSAGKGESIGLVLRGKEALGRGAVLFGSGVRPPRYERLEKALIFWVGEKPLKKGDSCLLRCATQETECTAENIRRFELTAAGRSETVADELDQNRPGLISFRLERPIVLQSFDREEELGKFVLEKDGRLLGFGVRKDSD